MEDLVRDNNGFIKFGFKYSKLYTKKNYLTSKEVIVARIYEYDVKSANISALRLSGEFDETQLAYLESLDKQDREVAVGKMIRENKKIYNYISKGIEQARHSLFKYNGITDEQVLAIKNDAVFVINRTLEKTKFGPMEFKRKNQYAAFMRLEKIEFLYDKRHDRIDIKGISDSVLSQEDHQNGMMEFFRKVMKYISLSDDRRLLEYLQEFSHKYKSRKLPHQYYRELNSENCYRTQYELSGYCFNLYEITKDQVDELNIAYNYLRFILPIIQLFCEVK